MRIDGHSSATKYSITVRLPRPCNDGPTLVLSPLPLGFQRRLREQRITPPLPPTRVARDPQGRPLRQANGQAVVLTDEQDADYLAERELYHQPRLPESFGRTVAEGMRVGCVPIVDAQGGFIEQLENGGGFLCADEAAFHTAVERLQDAKIFKETAARAERIGNERWSLARFARELLRRLDEAA